MKKLKMDYSFIIDVCKVIAVVAGLIGLWAYFMRKPEVKKEKQKIEEKIVVNETGVNQNKEDIVEIKNEIKDLRALVQEQRQVSLNYKELSNEEKDSIFKKDVKEKYGLGSKEIDNLIEKATKRTESYITQAMGYELKYDYANAIKFYEKALDEAVSFKDKAWILSSLGNRYIDIVSYEKAVIKYNESLSFYSKVYDKSNEDLLEIANIYACLGIIERKKANNYIGSIEYHEKAIEIRKELISKDFNKYAFDLSKSYNDIAVVFKHNGDLEKSISYNEKAIKTRRELLSKSDRIVIKFYIARSLNNLGNVYYSKGEALKNKQEDFLKYYEKSKNSIKEAIDLMETLKGEINQVIYDENLATFYINYGRALHSLGEYKNSIEPLKSAINSYKFLIRMNEERFIEPYVGAITNLARTYRDIGETEESLEMFKNAIQIQAKIIKNRKSSGDSEILLADIYFNLGLVFLMSKTPNEDLALNNFKSAYALYLKYPQSALAKRWAKNVKNRIDFLSDL